MKPASFEYFRPETVDEALGLLAEHAAVDAKPLAGGQSLIPMMNFRMAQPGALVDLCSIESLAEIREDAGALRIGAMVRHNDVKSHPLVLEKAPLVAMAYAHVAHFTIRNRGTLGGNLCHADPASEMPMVMLTLGADFVIASASGERIVPAHEFFLGTFTTAVEPGELLVAIRIPDASRTQRYAFEEVSLRKGDFAMSAVAAAIDIDDTGIVTHAAIGLAGVSDIPLRAEPAEAALLGRALDNALIQHAAELAGDALELSDTAAVSAGYRRTATRTLVERCLKACSGRIA